MAKQTGKKKVTQIKLTPEEIEIKNKQEFLADFVENYMENPSVFLKGNEEAAKALDTLSFKRVDITLTIEHKKRLTAKFTTIIDGKKSILEMPYKPSVKK